jgi:hypothetical protein
MPVFIIAQVQKSNTSPTYPPMLLCYKQPAALADTLRYKMGETVNPFDNLLR